MRGVIETESPGVSREGQQLRCSSLHVDGRRRVPARARVSPGGDTVAQVVAQDRLYAVGQVAQQHGVRGLPGRDGFMVSVDRFQDGPVAVDVELAFLAAVAQKGAFSRCVALTDLGSERSADPAVVSLGQALGGENNGNGVDVQPSGFLLGRQQPSG